MTQRKSRDDIYAARLFGQRLRQFRGDASQADFAKRLGLTRSSVANYERGRSLPKEDVIETIAERLGVPVSTLTGPATKDDVELAIEKVVDDENQVRTKDTPTGDEWAIIRALRTAEPEFVLNVVQGLIDQINSDPMRAYQASGDEATMHIARLYTIVQRDGNFDRGHIYKTFIELGVDLAVNLSRRQK